MKRIVEVCAALLLGGTLSAQQDPFMGDWDGVLRTDDGPVPVVAQVIARGNGEYQANILPRFDARVPAWAVLNGRVNGEVVRFTDGADAAIAADGTFSGELSGEHAGSFTMRHVRRESPTLGLVPPQGAIVLFDGSDLDEWESPTRPFGILNLRAAIGGDNRAAYLRNRVWSPAAQAARFELGSDDGVRVWVNGTVVHANNTPRPCQPGEDVFTTRLDRGWNEILIKIVQGGGDWAGCLRIVGPDGEPLAGMRAELAAEVDGELASDLTGIADGHLLCWAVSGPYSREGIGGTGLFDIAFPPETGQEAEWTEHATTLPGQQERWRLVDGEAMEVTKGGGAMVSHRTFDDHRIHLEFQTPYMPAARGQGRGNSGVYIQRRYEVQILDSYGLEGRDNECGGIYKISKPRVNMCAPPLQWQTYDITFIAPRFDANGQKTEHARLTVVHNGVTIHEDLALPGPTGGGRRGDLSTPGPILLQDHGNPVRFRNIWVLPLGEDQ